MSNSNLKTISTLDKEIFHNNPQDLRNPPLRKILSHLDNWIWEAGTDNFYWADQNFQNKAIPLEDNHAFDPLKDMPENEQKRVIEAFSDLDKKDGFEITYHIGSADQKLLLVKLEVNVIKNELGIVIGLKGCGKIVSSGPGKPGYKDLDLSPSDHLPGIGNLSINLSTGKMSFSKNMYRLLGYAPKEFQPTLENFLKIVHPEDVQSLSMTDINSYAEGKLSEQYRIYNSNQEIKHIRSYNKINNNEAGEKIINSTLLDITESFLLNKMLQEKMAYVDMALDNSIDIISAFDKDLICIAWNNKCEAEFGISKKEALGKHASALIKTPNQEQLLDNLNRAVNGEFIQFQEQEFIKDARYFERYYIPLKDESGRIFGVLATSHDITIIRNVSKKLNDLNYSLKEKNSELERTNGELASFSYIASHDLQEPLRKIQTFSRRLLETEIDNLSNQGKDYFRRMESASQRMQLLIDDLLTFSRTNTLPKDFNIADLNQILNEVKQELKEVIEEKNATIISDELPKANIIIFQFRQLLENVLGNSLKYAKPGIPLKINIKCSFINRDNTDIKLPAGNDQFIRLDVTDNGIGFDPQYSERIFELFQRLHGKHEYPGTGLGLAICRKIVQNHNGIMFSTGRPDEGATFSIIIPA